MYFIDQCPVCGEGGIKSEQAIMMPFVSEITEIWKPFAITREIYSDLDLGTAYFSTYTCTCDGCGLVYSKHRFSDGELDKLYSSYRGKHYNAIRNKYEPHYAEKSDYLEQQLKYLPEIESLIKSFGISVSKLMDWGGGQGLNTPLMGETLYAVAYDLSHDERYVELKNEIDQSEVFKEDFDLVVCMHVLEHVNYPVDIIIEATKKLRRDGLLYIEIPLEEGINFKRGGFEFGKKKIHWHEHINCFSARSIEKIIKKSGLNLLHLDTSDVSDEFRKFTVIQCVAQKKIEQNF